MCFSNAIHTSDGLSLMKRSLLINKGLILKSSSKFSALNAYLFKSMNTKLFNFLKSLLL